MGEKEILIPSGDLNLEGRLDKTPGEKGMIVTHPHPLFGGRMENNVVEAVVKAYREFGHTTLRFNFRGVGGSEGSYDNGMGEQEDMKAALDYIRGLGKTDIDLVGYSFGAWVNALGVEGLDLAKRLIMVSPPVGFMDFSFLGFNKKIRLVVAGSHDDIGPAEEIEKMIKTWNPDAQFKVIKGADHFYSGREDLLIEALKTFLSAGI